MSETASTSARRRWAIAAVAIIIVAIIVALLLLRSCNPAPTPPPAPQPPVRPQFSLIQPLARVTLQWQEGEKLTQQQDRILNLDDGLEYQWRVQAGIFPVAGTRRVLPAALETATRHNPWYRAGGSTETDETSFVFSRKVYQAIKAGKPIDLTMEDRFGPKADPATTRPVEFTATLTPTGADTITPTVNGRSETIDILRCTLRGHQIAILDDPAYPVGMAQAIQAVTTAIRCRLTDTHDAPIADARIAILPNPRAAALPSSTTEPVHAIAPTAPDGLFVLPPPDQADTYGKVTLQVTFHDQSTRNVNADLSAPGLTIVPVKIERFPNRTATSQTQRPTALEDRNGH